MSGRGILTDEIQAVAKNFLGREIDTRELRLYPYLDSILKNTGKLDYSKLNMEEQTILGDLQFEHHLCIVEDERLVVTRPFYDYMQSVLALSYVGGFMADPAPSLTKAPVTVASLLAVYDRKRWPHVDIICGGKVASLEDGKDIPPEAMALFHREVETFSSHYTVLYVYIK